MEQTSYIHSFIIIIILQLFSIDVLGFREWELLFRLAYDE
jgi:hypothetical protein